MMAFAVAGCGLALLGAGLSQRLEPTNHNGNASQEAVVLTSSRGTTVGGMTTYARIKVKYFQMSSTLPGVSQEYYVLQNPATFGELLDAVIESHPILSGMRPNMLILLDGEVAENDTVLRDGDEIDFIPAIAGG
jgi:molybdopterin converting factor small subunit